MGKVTKQNIADYKWYFKKLNEQVYKNSADRAREDAKDSNPTEKDVLGWVNSITGKNYYRKKQKMLESAAGATTKIEKEKKPESGAGATTKIEKEKKQKKKLKELDYEISGAGATTKIEKGKKQKQKHKPKPTGGKVYKRPAGKQAEAEGETVSKTESGETVSNNNSNNRRMDNNREARNKAKIGAGGETVSETVSEPVSGASTNRRTRDKNANKKTTSNADAALKTGSIGGIMAASGGRFGSSLAAATGGVKNLPDKKGDKKGEEEEPDSKAKDKSKKKKAGYFTRVKSFLGKKGEGVNAREVYRRQRKRGGSTKNLLTTDRKENYTMTGGRGKGLDVDSADKSYDSRYKKKKGGGTGASVNKKTSLTEGQKAKAMAKRMIELSATKPVYGGPGKAVKNNNKTGPGGNKSDWNTTKFTDPQLKTRNKRLFNVLKKGR